MSAPEISTVNQVRWTHGARRSPWREALELVRAGAALPGYRGPDVQAVGQIGAAIALYAYASSDVRVPNMLSALQFHGTVSQKSQEAESLSRVPRGLISPVGSGRADRHRQWL